jgi:hypothetical protein
MPPALGQPGAGRYFLLLHFLKIMYSMCAPDMGGRMYGRVKPEPEFPHGNCHAS